MKKPRQESWPTFKDLLNAYQNCRLGKEASIHQIHFERRLGENLLRLEHEIHTGRYRPSPASCFVVTQPKPREIFAAHFRDRIVHHLVVSQLEPFWEKKFIFPSFACRKRKGTHGALRYFQKKVRSLSRGGRVPLWGLQLDLASFFVTIHRPTLRDLLLKDAFHPTLRKLITVVYSHDARERVIKKGNGDLFSLIPPEKTWFNRKPEQGLPIGNLTSQFGANVYLNALDHWICRTLKPSAYLRYMDDLLLLGPHPEILEPMIEPIDRWLKTNRHQTLNPSKTKLIQLTEGVDYLGYRLRQMRNSSEPLQLFVPPKKKWEWISELRRFEQDPYPSSKKVHPLALGTVSKDLERKLAKINSRLGHLGHGKTYVFRKTSLERFVENTAAFPGIPQELGGPQPRFKIKTGYKAVVAK